MRSNEELFQLKAQAIALRRAGKSVREIKEALGPVGNSTLSWALRGVPPPEWTRRPRAKDAVRARARELRQKGRRRARAVQEANAQAAQPQDGAEEHRR